jgi:DNA repair exonuclease SbcCD ATPase subunit
MISQMESLTDNLKRLTLQREKVLKSLSTLDSKIATARTNMQRITEKKNELEITEHAVERFKSRIMKLPNQKIKQLLKSKDLYEKYISRGAGKYKLSDDFPHAVAVVKDFTVITVYSRYDPIERLEVLKAYMQQQWIDDMVEQMFDPAKNVMKLKTFRQKYYS